MNKNPKYLKMGLVRTSYEVFKGEGELVLYCEHLHSVKYKEPSDFKDIAEVKNKWKFLKGMTWDHARGFDPMIASAKVLFENPNVKIIWKRDPCKHLLIGL